MSLGKVIVLTVPAEMDPEPALRSGRLRVAIMSPTADEDRWVRAMAASARLLDLDAERSTFDSPKCVHRAAYNAALERVAKGGG